MAQTSYEHRLQGRPLKAPSLLGGTFEPWRCRWPGDPGKTQVNSKPKRSIQRSTDRVVKKFVQMLSSPESAPNFWFFWIQSILPERVDTSTVRCHGWAPGLFTEILPKQSLARKGDGKLQWLQRLHVCCSCLVGILLWVVARGGTIQNQENEWCDVMWFGSNKSQWKSHRRSCPSANNLSFNNSGTLNMGVCVCVYTLCIYILYIYTHILCVQHINMLFYVLKTLRPLSTYPFLNGSVHSQKTSSMYGSMFIPCFEKVPTRSRSPTPKFHWIRTTSPTIYGHLWHKYA